MLPPPGHLAPTKPLLFVHTRLRSLSLLLRLRPILTLHPSPHSTTPPHLVRDSPNSPHAFHPCDSFIRGLILLQKLRPSISLYHRARSLSEFISARTYVALLNVCAQLKDIRTGCTVHEDVFRRGLMEENAYVASALIHMYAACGSLAKAREVFHTIPAPNVVIWNALISGHVQHELCEEALQLLEEMQVHNVSPDSVTFACVLKACGSVGAMDKGMGIHSEVSRKGQWNRNVFLGSALVDMYVKCGMLMKAQEAFDMLEVRNVVTWTALIAGYAEYDYGDMALECLQQMRRDGFYPNPMTHASSLKACGSVGALDKGSEIHAEVSRLGLVKADSCIGNTLVDMYIKLGMMARAQAVFDTASNRNIITWTALIAGYVQHGCGNLALMYFEQMLTEGITPDAIVLACSLKACSSIGAIDKGRQIHSEIEQERTLRQDLSVGCALIDMYAKGGFPKKAQEVFNRLPVQNSYTWNTLITGFAQCGAIEDIISRFEFMIECGHKPDPITFLSVLNACNHAGLVEKGETYFQSMAQTYGITPNLLHHACILDALGRAGQLDKVEQMVKKTPFCPNTIMWQTVVGSCQKWHDIGLGRYAIQQLGSIRWDGH